MIGSNADSALCLLNKVEDATHLSGEWKARYWLATAEAHIGAYFNACNHRTCFQTGVGEAAFDDDLLQRHQLNLLLSLLTLGRTDASIVLLFKYLTLNS